ncbi:MAG: CoA pyrophosphatase [Bacteroidota bacterium]
MNLELLENRLSRRLREPLPGSYSHTKMSATAATGHRLRFKVNDHTRKGAVLILLFEREEAVNFVLTQRPEYNGTHGGQVSFPGGKQEENDIDLIATAIRETEEEIGVTAASINVVGTLSEFFVGASNHMVLPVVGTVPHVPKFVPDPHEVAEVFTVPLDHLLDAERVKDTVLEVGNDRFKLNAPYFDFHDKVVWGATAGMLSEFKDILLELKL